MLPRTFYIVNDISVILPANNLVVQNVGHSRNSISDMLKINQRFVFNGICFKSLFLKHIIGVFQLVFE